MSNLFEDVKGTEEKVKDILPTDESSLKESYLNIKFPLLTYCPADIEELPIFEKLKNHIHSIGFYFKFRKLRHLLFWDITFTTITDTPLQLIQVRSANYRNRGDEVFEEIINDIFQERPFAYVLKWKGHREDISETKLRFYRIAELCEATSYPPDGIQMSDIRDTIENFIIPKFKKITNLQINLQNISLKNMLSAKLNHSKISSITQDFNWRCFEPYNFKK